MTLSLSDIARRLRVLSRVLPLMLAGLALPGLVHAQTGEDALRFAQRFPGVGPRLTAMGGASLAGLADYGALTSNPAGLGFLKQSVFAGALGSTATTDESLFRLGGFTAPLEQNLRATGLGNLAYVHRVPTTQGNLVFGAAYNQVNTWSREMRFRGENDANSITDYFMPVPGEFEVTVGAGPDRIDGTADDTYGVDFSRPLSFIAFETFGIDFDRGLYLDGEAVPFYPAVVTGTVRQEGRVTEGGSLKELNFGGAVEALRGVMIGLSANFSFGSYDFSRQFYEEDFTNANDGNLGTTDFDNLAFTERFESSLVGINLRSGLSSEVVPGLRLGLTLETPTFFSVNDSYDTILSTVFDNGDAYTYGDEGEEDEGAGTFEYEITTPWRLGAGLAYVAGPVTISADAEFVDWSQLQLDASTDEAYFDGVNLDIRDNYREVINTRVGGEVWVGNLALRAGLAYQPDPVRSRATLADGDELDRSRTFLSAGIGYRFADQLEVDLGLSQERFEDQYRPYDVQNAPLVDEDVLRNRMTIGLRYSF